MTAARRKGAECEGVACEHALGQQPLQLYAYLWSKASVDEDGTGKRVFSFVLTDTVVFKRQKPTKWFFTSKQERGKVLCRTKRFLSTTRVMQEFLVPRWAPNTLPKLDNDKQILATYAYLDRTSVYGEMCMAVEHLDKDGLENLLEDREMPSLSVLQRFIPTKSGYNHTIRSVYTVDGCSVQKCISPFLLSDEKVSMVKRTATFEVNDPLLRHRDVTDKEVLKTVEKINGEIAAHLEPIVGKEMVRFVNYFKIGADHRIYLLWSSMLSFDAGIKGAAKSYGLSVGSHVLGAAAVPSNVEDSDAVATNQSLIGCTAQLKVCPNCNQMLPRDQVEYVVTYRSIIRQFERDDVENNSEEDANSIPTLLRAISGPIQAERFKQLKQTATYLQASASNSKSDAANSNTRQTSFVQVVDGIKCLVRPTARPSSDDQCVLHLELTKIPSENNQAMEITLKITEIIALLGSTGNTQHLTNQAALLEGILPLLQIRDSQLHIPAFQQQQLEEQQGCQQQQQEQQHLVANDASLSTSSAESAKLLPRRPPSRAAGHRVQFQ
ncbi:hypothetical protein PR001_g17454 [Phytophthora rubi]|uniref:Uncharacterized protein n=1 Tax=Phytophthora rubi TaxID=129364 RepID=A0A6A3KEF2_9STRA|nr:hypothetical protein PR001_g17454 [Phytophthora rubi]